MAVTHAGATVHWVRPRHFIRKGLGHEDMPVAPLPQMPLVLPPESGLASHPRHCLCPTQATGDETGRACSRWKGNGPWRVTLVTFPAISYGIGPWLDTCTKWVSVRLGPCARGFTSLGSVSPPVKQADDHVSLAGSLRGPGPAVTPHVNATLDAAASCSPRPQTPGWAPREQGLLSPPPSFRNTLPREADRVSTADSF